MGTRKSKKTATKSAATQSTAAAAPKSAAARAESSKYPKSGSAKSKGKESAAEEKAPKPKSDRRTGAEDFADREQFTEDSIEAAVQALKRMHYASRLTDGIGKDRRSKEPRSLVYDLVDAHAQFVRNMLGIVARANDQITDVLYPSGGRDLPEDACLSEGDGIVELKRKGKLIEGIIEISNDSRKAVCVAFDERIRFKSGPTEVDVSPDYLCSGKKLAPGEPRKIPPRKPLSVRIEFDASLLATRKDWTAESTVVSDRGGNVDLLLILKK